MYERDRGSHSRYELQRGMLLQERNVSNDSAHIICSLTYFLPLLAFLLLAQNRSAELIRYVFIDFKPRK